MGKALGKNVAEEKDIVSNDVVINLTGRVTQEGRRQTN